MFNSIIEFIQNSVITVVGLTMGALGIGNGNVLNEQTATISDAVLPVEEVSLNEGIVEEEGSDSEAVAPLAVVTVPAEIDYFERVALPSATFIRPVTGEDPEEDNTPILVQDAQTIRSINPVKSTQKTKEVDATLILKTDFDNFDPNLQIIKITEDDNGFYSTYQFNSFVIEDNVWREAIKEKQISVSKTVLGKQDLGKYLSKELGEVIDNEIVFLKEVQAIQRTKLAKAETSNSNYGSLIGKVLDVTEGQFDNYVPTKTSLSVEDDSLPITTTQEVKKETDNQAPLLIIQGNNPALIQIGSSYLDLGARVTDNVSDNLTVITGGDVVDTSVKGSYFVDYSATDEAGNTATATREVIVYDYGSTTQIETEPIVVEEETPEAPIIPTVVNEEVPATSTPEIITSEVEVTPEETVSAGDVVSEVSETVIEGGKNAGKKVKETLEAVGETTTAVIETVSETTSEALEQISAGVETVAEEVSAMIRKVRILELIGQIRSALQASISSVSSTLRANVIGANSVLSASIFDAGGKVATVTKVLGQFVETIGVNVAEIINGFIDKNYSIFSESAVYVKEVTAEGLEKTENFVEDLLQKIGLREKVLGFFDEMVASVGHFNIIYDLFGEENQDENNNEVVISQEKSFFEFAFQELLGMPRVFVKKVTETGSNLTATVKNYGKTVSSDLEVVGQQLNTEINQTDLTPGGIIQGTREALTGMVSSVVTFFKNHRPE